MRELTDSVVRAIKEFERLPGIGKKSAERIVYFLLKAAHEDVYSLADSIRVMKERVRYCKCCFNLAEDEFCDICRDESRDRSTICVVEQARDLVALEKTGQYHGMYHVLLGEVAPLEGVTDRQLTINALMERLRQGHFTEIIMATNPTLEGDGTVQSIMGRLAGMDIKITRLARGVSSGCSLEFANSEILSDALRGRQRIVQD